MADNLSDIYLKFIKLIIPLSFILASCNAPAASTPPILPSLVQSETTAAIFTSTPVPTNTFTPEPTATKTPNPTLTFSPTPTQMGGGSGKLLFTMQKKDFINRFPKLTGEQNIFIANIRGTELNPVTDGLDGFNYINAVSPDNKRALVTSSIRYDSATANLYIISLSSSEEKPFRLARGIMNGAFGNNSAAKWIDNDRVVYAGQGDKGYGIYTINADGLNALNIDRNSAFEILAITNSTVYWDIQKDHVEGGNRHFLSYDVWWTSLDGKDGGQLKFKDKQISVENYSGPGIAFSPDNSKIAWVEGYTPFKPPYRSYLHIADLSNIQNASSTEVLAKDVILTWFSDGTRVLVFNSEDLRTPLEKILNDVRLYPDHWKEIFEVTSSENLEKMVKDRYGLYEFSVFDNSIKNYNLTSEKLAFFGSGRKNVYGLSPDGYFLIFRVTYSRKMAILNLEDSTISEVLPGNTAYDVYWLH
jgi:hypothetical protein